MRRSFWRRCCAAALAAAACLALAGCSGLQLGAVEDLYSLPSLPKKYQNLETSINAILEDGGEYAAPTSGSNVQPVQLMDLDGDGQEEALAFVRKSTEEKPLKIHIFTARDGNYEQTAVIEGSGTAILSVVYTDLEGDGRNELLVGWKVAAEMQALSVYSLRGGQPQELLRTTYVKYALTDLNANGKQELVIFRADGEGLGLAELYAWQDGALGLRSSCKISVTMAELSNLGRVVSGTLQGGVPALYVVGVADSTNQITDILTAGENGELTNIVLSDITGATTEIARFLSLYPMDINGDGVTEVPVPVMLPSLELEELYYRVDWRSYAADGESTVALSTYHDVDDGWYLVLPEAWRDRVQVARSIGSDEATVTFSYREDGGTVRDFLRISTITGDSREIKAVRGGRFILARQAETIYSAELPESGAGWEYAMSQDDLRAAFNRITTAWMTGDN